MNFNAKFADVVQLFAPQIFEPPKPVVVEVDGGQVTQTGRSYPCVVCDVRTGWRGAAEDCPPVPVCSEECYQAFLSEGSGGVAPTSPVEPLTSNAVETKTDISEDQNV
jgi:hypothetical protein